MGRIRNTEEIQDFYAKSKGYDTFFELLEADKNAIDWHVSNVQKMYASEVNNPINNNCKIVSIVRLTDGQVFRLGDNIKFNDKYGSFKLERIVINSIEKQVELYGEKLFCSLIESNPSVISLDY